MALSRTFWACSMLMPYWASCLALPYDIEEISLVGALGKHAAGSGHGSESGLDLGADLFDLLRIVAGHLQSHRRANAAGQHVDAALDRHGPRVADAGHA